VHEAWAGSVPARRLRTATSASIGGHRPAGRRAAFHPSREPFVQHYDTDVLDAALLRMSGVGFIASNDPLWT
jgi:GH15 family glucan-1,4-alpha-glucosidase